VFLGGKCGIVRIVGDRQQENNFSVRIKRYTFGDILLGTGNRKTASDVVETDARGRGFTKFVTFNTHAPRGIDLSKVECGKSHVLSIASIASCISKI